MSTGTFKISYPDTALCAICHENRPTTTEPVILSDVTYWSGSNRINEIRNANVPICEECQEWIKATRRPLLLTSLLSVAIVGFTILSILCNLFEFNWLRLLLIGIGLFLINVIPIHNVNAMNKEIRKEAQRWMDKYASKTDK